MGGALPGLARIVAEPWASFQPILALAGRRELRLRLPPGRGGLLAPAGERETMCIKSDTPVSDGKGH